VIVVADLRMYVDQVKIPEGRARHLPSAELLYPPPGRPGDEHRAQLPGQLAPPGHAAGVGGVVGVFSQIATVDALAEALPLAVGLSADGHPGLIFAEESLAGGDHARCGTERTGDGRPIEVFGDPG